MTALPLCVFVAPFRLVSRRSAVGRTGARAVARSPGRVVDPQGRPVAGATVVAVGATSAAALGDDRRRRPLRVRRAGRRPLRPHRVGAGPARRSARRRRSAARRARVEITLRVSAVTETLRRVGGADRSTALAHGRQRDDHHRTRARSAAGHVARRRAAARCPGFTVAQSGGPGTLTSLFPRGGESDFTLVLVDGIRANAFGGGIDLSQVPIADVERIEVVRGPQSALYGADAIGGVVQIITRHGGPPIGQRRSRGRQPRHAPRRQASTDGSSRGVPLAGRRRLLRRTRASPASRRPTASRSSNDDAQERQGWVGGGWRGRARDRRAGHVPLCRYRSRRARPVRLGSGRPLLRRRSHRARHDRAAMRSACASCIRGPAGEPRAPARRVRRRRLRSGLPQPVRDLGLRDAPRARPRADRRRARRAASASRAASSGSSERARSTFITPDGVEVPVERRVIGTFGEVALERASSALSVQAGLRAEHITREDACRRSIGVLAAPDFATIRSSRSIRRCRRRGWSAGRCPATARARGRGCVPRPAPASVRRTRSRSRSPTIPNLKPERSRASKSASRRRSPAARVQLDATTFFNRYDDLIVSVGSLQRRQPLSHRQRLERAGARRRAERARGRAATGLSVRASYTFLDTEIRAVDGSAQAPSPYQVGDALLRRPRHQGIADVDMDATARVVRLCRRSTRAARRSTPSRRSGRAAGSTRTPATPSSTSAAAFRIVRGVDVFARVLNLFDRDYEEVLGYPSPGRTAFAGVRVAAGR